MKMNKTDDYWVLYGTYGSKYTFETKEELIDYLNDLDSYNTELRKEHEEYGEVVHTECFRFDKYWGLNKD